MLSTNKESDIPEGSREHYKQVGDKWVLDSPDLTALTTKVDDFSNEQSDTIAGT